MLKPTAMKLKSKKMDRIPQMQVTLVFGRQLKFNSSEKNATKRKSEMQ